MNKYRADESLDGASDEQIEHLGFPIQNGYERLRVSTLYTIWNMHLNAWEHMRMGKFQDLKKAQIN